MKKILSLLVILTLAISLVSCELLTGKNPDQNPPPKSEVGTAAAFVTVDINPSIEITLDEAGVVASVYGANEDGQILLYGEAEVIVGLSYEEAIAYITNLAVELGYLDAETGTINTSVVADDLAFAEEIQSKLGAKIEATATENGITVTIDTSDPFSLLCELEELKAKYPDRADVQSLTPTEYKLALTLSEREHISIIAALEYDSSEMIERISAAHSTLESYATESYLAAKREATRIFEKAMGIHIAGAYNEIYMKNHMKHLGTFYYGAAYQAYATSAITYRSIYEIKQFGDSMASFQPSAATVESLKNELGLTDTTALEDENGNITLDSLIKFCDEFMAHNEVPEDVKSEVQHILADVKVAAELKNKATTSMYSADLVALKAQIKTVVATVNGAYTTTKIFMTDEQKTDIEACLVDLDLVTEKVDEILEGGISLTDVDLLATDAEIKAAEMLEKIKADLSEEELAAADARIEELKNLQAELTAEFEERLAKAEMDAKKYIEDAREARKNANSAN